MHFYYSHLKPTINGKLKKLLMYIFTILSISIRLTVCTKQLVSSSRRNASLQLAPPDEELCGHYRLADDPCPCPTTTTFVPSSTRRNPVPSSRRRNPVPSSRRRNPVPSSRRSNPSSRRRTYVVPSPRRRRTLGRKRQRAGGLTAGGPSKEAEAIEAEAIEAERTFITLNVRTFINIM